MKTFTIDENNSIAVFGSQEEAEGATGVAFSSQKELAKPSAEWPLGRFVEIWNCFAGVAPFGDLNPVRKFTDRKVAVARIWQAIQRLNAEAVSSSTVVTEQGSAIAPESVAEIPLEVVTGAPQVPDVAPEVVTATTDASPVDNAPAADAVTEPVSTEQTATKQSERKKAPNPAQDSAAPRETKLSQVVAMLHRPEGVTISEIMQRMGWLKHTVRGFMAGTMKKAGYAVESFKPEGGERSYRINPK